MMVTQVRIIKPNINLILPVLRNLIEHLINKFKDLNQNWKLV